MFFMIDFYKALADQTRLDLLALMAKKGEICVCDFSSTLDLSQPKISRHLAILKNAELITPRKQGKWVYYQINKALAPWQTSTILDMANAHPTIESLLQNFSTQSDCC